MLYVISEGINYYLDSTYWLNIDKETVYEFESSDHNWYIVGVKPHEGLREKIEKMGDILIEEEII